MILKTWQGFALLSIALLIAAGCGDDKGNGPIDNPYDRINLDLFVVAPLGAGMVYELWVSPKSGLAAATDDWVSVVRFDVIAGTGGTEAQLIGEDGSQISDTLSDIGVDLEDYDSIFITIEPSPDNDSMPSGSIYFSGDIDLSITTFVVLEFPGTHLETLNPNAFFTYTTPTDEDTTEANEIRGVWFMLAGQQEPGLFGLQPAPDGWVYEGWAKLGDTLLSTGRFASPDGADQGNPYSGMLSAPPYPGEDFLLNSPRSGLFPYEFQTTDTIMVTVEPVDDPLPATPFPYIIYVNRPGQTPTNFQNFRLDKRDDADGVFPDAHAVILRRSTG